MEVNILPCRAAEAGVTQGHEFPCFKLRLKIKSALFLIGNLLFHEGNATEKCASSSVFAPEHGVGSNKEVSKSYLHMFFSSLSPPSSLKDDLADLL